MNPRVPKLVLTLGVALTLGACASMPDFHAGTPEYRLLAQVHSGLTQDEVRSLAGKPGNVMGGSRSGEKVWVYAYQNEWGKASEFDVTFDPTGRASSTYSEEIS